MRIERHFHRGRFRRITELGIRDRWLLRKKCCCLKCKAEKDQLKCALAGVRAHTASQPKPLGRADAESLRLAEEAAGKKKYCFRSYSATPETAWIATRADWVSFHKCAVWRQSLMEATRLCVEGSAPNDIARALKEYKSLSWEYEPIFSTHCNSVA